MSKGLSKKKERERREETRERKSRGAAVFPTLSQQLGYSRCSWLLLGRGSGRLGRAMHTPALLPLLVFPGAPLHVWVCGGVACPNSVLSFSWGAPAGTGVLGAPQAPALLTKLRQKGILLQQASQEKTETGSQSWLRVLRIRGGPATEPLIPGWPAVVFGYYSPCLHNQKKNIYAVRP